MKSYTKSQLATAYGVPYKVFARWLKDLSEIIKPSTKKFLSPKEIESLIKEKGEPDWKLILGKGKD